jgi:hypothetical protein
VKSIKKIIIYNMNFPPQNFKDKYCCAQDITVLPPPAMPKGIINNRTLFNVTAQTMVAMHVHLFALVQTSKARSSTNAG